MTVLRRHHQRCDVHEFSATSSSQTAFTGSKTGSAVKKKQNTKQWRMLVRYHTGLQIYLKRRKNLQLLLLLPLETASAATARWSKSSTYAPLSRSSLTTWVCPPRAAMVRTLAPSLLRPLISAPFSKRMWPTVKWPNLGGEIGQRKNFACKSCSRWIRMLFLSQLSQAPKEMPVHFKQGLCRKLQVCSKLEKENG